MADLARALGRADDAARYMALGQRIRAAFGEHFVDAEGRVRGETQTAYALALHENLVPQELRERAKQHFAAAVEGRGHLTTGFVGTPELLHALRESDRGDLAYRLLRAHELPSWGYMIDQGATTLWERWDAWTPEHGLAAAGNVSLSHTPLGSAVAWLFDSVAGIRPAEPGFRSLTLTPVPGGGLSWAEASYDSIRGRIALRWELAGSSLRMDVTVPPNVTATLNLHPGPPGKVEESGNALGAASGVRVLGTLGDAVLLELASGRY